MSRKSALNRFSEPVKVLDKGFVRLVDLMGDDAAVVQAARVSYGAGTKRVSEDVALIRYLMRHRHTTPFEQCEIKLHVRVPMDCWRQWIRTRTASVNEYSTRYSEAIEDTQATDPSEWRLQSRSNKQGSSGMVTEWPGNSPPYDPRESVKTPGEWLSDQEGDLQRHARLVYEERLRFGVAREQARKDLPLSTYTEAYWKIDLHNLLHFLSLRMDSHAQLEIRQYANVIGEIVSEWCPATWDAFRDFRLGSTTLSKSETEIVRSVIAPTSPEWDEELRRFERRYHWFTPQKPGRELAECLVRLEELGLQGFVDRVRGLEERKKAK